LSHFAVYVLKQLLYQVMLIRRERVSDHRHASVVGDKLGLTI